MPITANFAQISRTFYDQLPNFATAFISSSPLRGRVAATQVAKELNSSDTLGAMTFYAYDIHGNVANLTQKLPNLQEKRMEYEYDLIAGKVNNFVYQRGQKDAFYHRYDYDADNRLNAVYTSLDGYLWDNDASYFYYPQGALGRVEMGQDHLQALDYTYTLQGWIKGVNLEDEEVGLNKSFAKDLASYQLDYFSGDYKSIKGIAPSSPASMSSLYNGNIASMSTKLKTLGTETNIYRYDQLNRIKSVQNQNKQFLEKWNYDPNGNITKYQNGNQMPQNYAYNIFENNQLNGIDNVLYAYDKIGNLVKEIGIAENKLMQWNVYGKLAQIGQTGKFTNYFYDATGNKIAEKDSKNLRKSYIRDASGNILAIYQSDTLQEMPIYGATRLGIYNGKGKFGKRILNNKTYEITNHLGNVISTFTDNKFTTAPTSETQYFAFGSVKAQVGLGYRYGFNGKEKATNLGTDSYDFGARFLKDQRWWSPDPLASKYPSLSPYAFVANMPLSAIDPDGKDIIILSDPKGAGYMGHRAVLIGNQIDGWTYISKDGFSGNPLLGSTSKFTIMKFKSIEEFANSPHNFVLADGYIHSSDINNLGINGKDENGNEYPKEHILDFTVGIRYKRDKEYKKIQRYENAFYIDTDENTNQKMIDAAKKEAKKDYVLFQLDCSDVSTAALKAGKDRNGQAMETGDDSGNRFTGSSNPIRRLVDDIPRLKYMKIVTRNSKIGYNATEMIKPSN